MPGFASPQYFCLGNPIFEKNLFGLQIIAPLRVVESKDFLYLQAYLYNHNQADAVIILKLIDMENNEQLDQNSVVSEGVENEKITSKASKKAIDANEKKKIIKLIQPSILPAKVRIEVHTLIEEAKAEVAPVVDEVGLAW